MSRPDLDVRIRPPDDPFEWRVNMVFYRNSIISDQQGFNRRWYAPNLEAVYLPTHATDVVEAWADVIANKKGSGGELQITGGRHCYENFVYNPKTKFIIDTTGLRDYGYDSRYGYYIDVGYGNWDMYRIFNNVYGLTLPAGSCYSVGLGGHLTGGGYGLLSRLHGLTVDHITAVDIVIQQDSSAPELITASASENPDLYWALRGGGGGNFGIITRYYFSDPPRSPATMYSDAFTFEWRTITSAERLGELLEGFSAYCSIQNDQELWSQFGIFHTNHQAAKSISVIFYCFDVPSEGKTGSDYEAFLLDHISAMRRQFGDIAPLSDQPGNVIGHPWHGDTRSVAGPGDGTLRQYTYLEGVQNANGSGPNRFGKYKSAYMNKGFTPDMVEALYAGLTSTPVVGNHVPLDMSQSLCQIDSYGCAINELTADATPIPQRSSIMKLQYQTYWDNASPVGCDNQEQAQGHLDWIKGLYTDVYAVYGGYPNPYEDSSGTVDGCYYN